MSSPGEVVLAADAMFTPGERLAPGWVHVRDGRIVAVGAGSSPRGAPVLRMPEGARMAPGFVDVHVHGGGGAQVGPDPRAIADVARFHARHGTTGLLATAVPAPEQTLLETVRAVVAVRRRPPPDAARLLGCHLEGPFLSPQQAGALDSRQLRAPDRAELDRLIAAGEGSVRMIVVAPELPGALDVIAAAAAHGLVVAIGHTEATYDQAIASFARGARATTHLFNAMRPLHHREPGAVGAALDTPQVTAEIIADGVHVHASALRLAHAVKGPHRMTLVTDAVEAAGLPDGDYMLGERPVTMIDGQVRLVDGGALAGSTLTMDRALQVSVEAGLPIIDALTMATATPATLLGVAEATGRIAAGCAADLVVLDERLGVVGTMVAGRWVWRDRSRSVPGAPSRRAGA